MHKTCFLINRPKYILRDFNLPHIDWSIPKSFGNQSHNYFINFCFELSLQQMITEPTHSDGNILDLLLCNLPASNLLKSWAIDEPLTDTCDHILVKFSIVATSEKQSCQKFLDFTNADYPSVACDLFHTDWQLITQANRDNVQRLYDNIIKHLHLAIDHHVPYKTHRKPA